MVREAATSRTSTPAKTSSTPTSTTTRIRRPDAASARYVIAAAGFLCVCRSHSKAKNKNCYRNQLSHLRPFFGGSAAGDAPASPQYLLVY